MFAVVAAISSTTKCAEAGGSSVQRIIVQQVPILFHRRPTPCGIDHNHVIAHIDVRRVQRAGLAGENAGGMRGETAKRLSSGVDDVPLTLDVLAAGDGGGLIQVQRVTPYICRLREAGPGVKLEDFVGIGCAGQSRAAGSKRGKGRSCGH